MGPVSWTSLALCAGVGAGAVAYYQIEMERKRTQVSSQTKTVGKAAIGGPFSLVDTEGRPVTDADFRGKFMLIYFGFTFCPDICPNELVKIASLLDTIKATPEVSGTVDPIFISIDPQRDTVQQIKSYSQDFHPSIRWLTGSEQQVKAAAKAFRVYWTKADIDEKDDDLYQVEHSVVWYLMDPDGEFVEFYLQSDSEAKIIEKTMGHLKAYQAEQLQKEKESQAKGAA
eukprot:g3351.t1